MIERIGLIGLGEAGAAIAAGLSERGIDVSAVDVRGDTAPVRERARRCGATLVASLDDLATSNSVIICLTSAKAALELAEQIAPCLTSEHLYSDWNSASPRLKRDIADVLRVHDGAFVDGAVMAAVPPHRHAVPVLLSGPGAHRLHDSLDGLGMQLEVLGAEAGQASAVKMFRSLLVKGLEALLLECAVGAHQYGAAERVFESMNETLSTQDWTATAEYLMRRTILHGERRAEEMRQVAGTLRECDVEPLLAEAGAKRLQWFADMGVGDLALTEELDYHGVLNVIEEARH